MYVFDVKSYTESECHKDKKGIKKTVTGSVSVPGLRMKEPVDVVLSMSDPATSQL